MSSPSPDPLLKPVVGTPAGSSQQITGAAVPQPSATAPWPQIIVLADGMMLYNGQPWLLAAFLTDVPMIEKPVVYQMRMMPYFFTLPDGSTGQPFDFYCTDGRKQFVVPAGKISGYVPRP